ncbi:HNH endonuclease signature motif containing protein [Janthinobacterium sp. GMG1]|uniref:HNH endonuclease n=1 Tax=Janthinobacterium sp. GMG1 TaxID=3096007 RepID=UPI002ACA6306|nr:HNH endonuclease signature motif containing protein [Janthinobacterium sp. GMG1]MDZ5631922.1 HNH endonuclease signature motif containing protein [Janthinobacterium sp. GMG1]
MMKITEEQVSAAYQVAKKVFDGHMKATYGGKVLSSEHGLNDTTANDFIVDYKCLLEGRVFYRAMSASAMRYFMEQIFAENDEHCKVNAITALRGHIAYYENHYKTRMHLMREVANYFDALMQRPKTIVEVEGEFAVAVERSLRGSSRDRLRRLANAGRKPTSIVVQSTVFVRNPDVVAERLLRAGGRCESCLAEAPFMRAKDGTPYLEVHHKVRLAAGGDDSIENTVALCPNCHRRFHHGAATTM